MPAVIKLILHSVFFINVIVGMPLNLFIVLMNCRTWRRKKSLPAGDQIVTSLCLSRWIFQCLITAHHTSHFFLPSDNFNNFFTPARILLNYLSIWLASLLCVYYCVKISTYQHVGFLYVKARMSKMVPWCLGLCVFLSLVFIQPYAWHFFSLAHKASRDGNMTKENIGTSYTYFIGSSPPFIIFIIAFLLTVPSLWRHIRNMRGDGTSFRNPDMKSHYNAIKSMAAFFLLHIFFLIIVNINLSGVLNVGDLYNPLTVMLISFYPCLHSAVIIFYNTKLRQGFLIPLKCMINVLQKKAVIA
uniref:Taste receptor type 2 n=1 Tax=Pyxicephalus adspersus TaxID=30357 RepID=A0AAV3AFU1_PYXAD|nr:TPA: hypothetical protein GDO54_009821 [Pyxicephalus adspersus]